MKDLHNNLAAALLLAPDQITGDTNTLSVDLLGYDGCELFIAFGDFSNTLGASPEVSVDVIIQESDDDSTFAAVTDDDDLLVAANANVAAPDDNGVIATLDNDGDADKLLRVGYVGSKRYVRVKIDENGDCGNVDVVVIAIKGYPKDAPATDASAEISL